MSIRAADDSLELARRSAAPHAVKGERKQVIQKIVTRRNPAEHFPHVRRSFAFAASALGTRARRLLWKYRRGH